MKNIEEIALENAQRAYQRAVINGESNPDEAAERAHQKTMNTIRPGMRLTARSPGDLDCIFSVDVLKRTQCSVTVRSEGKVKQCKIHSDDTGEFIYALGRYSMCPVFRAPTKTLNQEPKNIITLPL